MSSAWGCGLFNCRLAPEAVIHAQLAYLQQGDMGTAQQFLKNGKLLQKNQV